MSSITKLYIVVGVVVLFPAHFTAQTRPVEIGLDGGINISFNGMTTARFTIPCQSVRVGYFVNNNVSLEPVASFNYTKMDSFDAIATIGLEFAALFNFSPDRSNSQPYFRPLVGLTLITAGGVTASQFRAGGGFGIRLPVATQFAVRLEAGFGHYFENDDFAGASTLVALFGLSFLTR